MKKQTFRFYHIDEPEKPTVLDDIIILGKDHYDVITYNGEFLPAWVEWWCKLDFSEL